MHQCPRHVGQSRWTFPQLHPSRVDGRAVVLMLPSNSTSVFADDGRLGLQLSSPSLVGTLLSRDWVQRCPNHWLTMLASVGSLIEGSLWVPSHLAPSISSSSSTTLTRTPPPTAPGGGTTGRVTVGRPGCPPRSARLAEAVGLTVCAYPQAQTAKAVLFPPNPP